MQNSGAGSVVPMEAGSLVPMEAKYDDTYQHFKDFVGHERSDAECAALIDELYMIDGNYTLHLTTSNNEWRVKRGVGNDSRSNMAAVMSRKTSVENIGLILAMRKSPWLVAPAPGSDGLDEVMHWATILEGTKEAWLADTNRENKLVQLAVSTPIPGCKRYDHRMPMHARKFLAYWGNITNSEVLDVTVIEVWKSTAECDAGWARRKSAMGWSLGNTSQATLDMKRFEYACALYPRRWDSWRSLEVCGSFYRRSKETLIPKGMGFEHEGMSVWDVFENEVRANVNLMDPACKNHTPVFTCAYTIFKRLRLDLRSINTLCLRV